MQKYNRPDWGTLFQSVLAEPGRLGTYYNLFHRYSLGNQALAMHEMETRGIPIGPISSFNGWKKVGRKVKKGEKAIALWMPVIKKEIIKKDDGAEEETTKLFFIMKNNWFALAQTEPINPQDPGTVPVPETPEWDRALALKNLGITEVPFKMVNGNCQGYAKPDAGEIAVSPLAAMPWKTTFHEMAHCLLHKKEQVEFIDSDELDRSFMEAEAESVAFLCCATLGLPGLEEARGYVQSVLHSSATAEEFKKKCASKVFAAADKILKAGKPSPSKGEEEEENS